MKLLFSPLKVLSTFFLLTVSINDVYCDLILHLDSSVSGSVLDNSGNPVGAVTPVQTWSDQSIFDNDGTRNRGSVYFPGTADSATGLSMLDFGSERNDLVLLNGTEARAVFDFGAEAAGNDGFSVLVAFRVDALPGVTQFITGTRHTNGHFAIYVGGNGKVTLKLDNNMEASGSLACEVGDTVVVGVTYTAATGTYQLWESKNDVTRSGVQTGRNYGKGNNLTLGEAKVTSSSNDYFRGRVGEVKVFNHVLPLEDFLQERTAMVAKWVTGGEPPLDPLAPGPGFPSVAQTEGALLGEAWTDPTDQNARTVVLDYVNGYLLMDSRSVASGSSSSSRQVWDISDPSNPVEVPNTRVGSPNPMHTAFMYIPGNGHYYRVNNPGNSIVEARDPLNLTLETPAGLLPTDQGSRSAHVFPYQYFGGSTLRIYDARTGEQVAISEHGFAGQPTPIGNLLLLAGIRGETRRIATYDISDPMSPSLMSVLDLTTSTAEDPDGNPGYEPFIWKNYLIMANVLGGGVGDDIGIVDFSDPNNLRHVLYYNGKSPDLGYSTGLPGRTRYGQIQDNMMFLGGGKYDLTPVDSGNPPTLVRAFLEQDGEYMLPLGNLMVSAENSDQGGIPDIGLEFPFRIFAHQSAPDTNPPTIVFHNPADGAVNQHVKSRIGVVIHETLDYQTINSTTFRVFPTSGGADVAGTFTHHDKDVLNFTPNEPLAEGVQYTVLVDGIRDVAGNAMAADSFTFTTAGEGSPSPIVIESITYSEAYPAPLDTPIPFSVTATGGSKSPLDYKWTMGDGTLYDWTPGNSAPSHSYAQPGHYRVQAQVSDGSQTRTATITVTVTTPVTGPLPTKASQIIVDEINNEVWTVNPDNNKVSKLDISGETPVLSGEYTVAADPRSIAQDAAGNIWVACLDADRVEVLDRTDGSLLSVLDFHPGSRPHEIAFNQAKTHAYVSLKGSGLIARVEPGTLNTITVNADHTPTALALTSDGNQLLVTRFISPDTSGEVRLFTDAAGSISAPSTIALAIDAVSGNLGDSGEGLPNYLADVVITPDNGYAFVSSKQDNILRGLAKDEQGDDLRDGVALGHDSTTRAIVSKISLTTGQEEFSTRVDIDDSSQPTAMVLSPHGDYLFVALQGNNRVEVIDVFDGKRVASLNVGLAPQGLALDSSNRLYVKNLNDRTVTVYDLTNALELGLWNIEPLAPPINTLSSEAMDPIILAGKKIFYNAEDPRMSLEGYTSCAVCHQDGDHDGRVWDFTDRGEGLRNTTNLRGRSGTGHGRVHWSANFDQIQDFEFDIRGPFGGTGFYVDSEGVPLPIDTPLTTDTSGGAANDLNALAAYVQSLNADSVEKSPYKNADGSLTAEGQAGQELFLGVVAPASGNVLSCNSCHSADTQFTDSNSGVLHNVGTIKASSGQRLGQGPGSLTGIDTPTLMGVQAAAPFFHDGSAATLEEVFDPARAMAASGEVGNVHDLSSSGFDLTAAERANLVAYLRQIDGGAANPPTVSFANITEGQTFPFGSTVQVTVNANDSDGIKYVRLYLDGHFVRQENRASYDWGLVGQDDAVLENMGEGTYTLVAVATDQEGASAGVTLSFTIDPAPPVNNPPVFAADPFSATDATADVAYSDTIAGSASDPDVGDTLTYSKVSGPAWLSVASDGALSGTPGSADVGENAFVVRVTDGAAVASATLNITVQSAPPAASTNLSVQVDSTSGTETLTKTWTVSNMTDTSANVTNGVAVVSGSAASLISTDTFSVTASALDDWSTSAAQGAADFGQHLSDLAGTSGSGIGALNNGLMGVYQAGANGNTWINGTNEAIVLTINTNGLPVNIALTQIRFANFTATDRCDFLIYDASANAIMHAEWNKNFNGPDAAAGSWILQDGDMIIVATGSNNADQFRIDSMTFQLTD